jgi:hypothetical protein
MSMDGAMVDVKHERILSKVQLTATDIDPFYTDGSETLITPRIVYCCVVRKSLRRSVPSSHEAAETIQYD